MLEGVADGRAALSQLREKVGLPPLPIVPHNLDFNRQATLRLLEGLFARVDLEANGLYDLVTRVLYPHAIAPAEPDYNSAVHRSAAAIAKVEIHVRHILDLGCTAHVTTLDSGRLDATYSSTMYLGRPRASSKVRHRYSPKTPSMKRILPCPTRSTVIVAANPVPTATHPASRPTTINNAYKKPPPANEKPITTQVLQSLTPHPEA
jgi:hypothetical protein